MNFQPHKTFTVTDKASINQGDMGGRLPSATRWEQSPDRAQTCSCFYLLLTGQPVPRWPDPRWSEIWREAKWQYLTLYLCVTITILIKMSKQWQICLWLAGLWISQAVWLSQSGCQKVCGYQSLHYYSQCGYERERESGYLSQCGYHI